MNGRAGKEKLSPIRMDKLKTAVFEQYPFEGYENEMAAWGDCVRAIDEAGRKIKD